jgi:hypothetical protein
MDAHRTSSDISLDHLNDALARWAGSGALIIEHMTRWPAHGERSAVDTLKELMRSTLEPLADRHAVADLAAAAAVIGDAVETLASEIHLVEPPPF